MIMWHACTTSACVFSLKPGGLQTARWRFNFWLSPLHWLYDLCTRYPGVCGNISSSNKCNVFGVVFWSIRLRHKTFGGISWTTVFASLQLQVQQHCSEHSTGFQWRLGFSTKLLVSVFSVSIRTVCHLLFLTFFIHTVPLGRCALLTSLSSLCWQFLASLLRPLGKDLSLFLDPLSGTHYHYPSEKQCFTTFKMKVKTHLFHIHLCWSASVSFCMYHSEGVCVCACVCVCVCAIISMVGVIYMYADMVFRFYVWFFLTT